VLWIGCFCQLLILLLFLFAYLLKSWNSKPQSLLLPLPVLLISLASFHFIKNDFCHAILATVGFLWFHQLPPATALFLLWFFFPFVAAAAAAAA